MTCNLGPVMSCPYWNLTKNRPVKVTWVLGVWKLWPCNPKGPVPLWTLIRKRTDYNIHHNIMFCNLFVILYLVDLYNKQALKYILLRIWFSHVYVRPKVIGKPMIANARRLWCFHTFGASGLVSVLLSPYMSTCLLPVPVISWVQVGYLYR